MIQEQLREDSDGVIVFDAARTPHIDNHWFVPDFWHHQGALRAQTGGRGGIFIIKTPTGECVLRHYRRGGWANRLLGDRYFWYGARHTRPFAEFRLLVELARRDLPAPIVVAARYVRRGLFYRADLITAYVPGAVTLAQRLAMGRLDVNLAEAVGVLLARFHRSGVCHADLNAHNILVSAQGLYLIDFDRATIRIPQASWRLANLQRLRRSLVKLGAAKRSEPVFTEGLWAHLRRSYERTIGI